MAQSFLEVFKAAKRVSTSLIAIKTPDPAATMQLILEAYQDSSEVPPMLCHDIVRGLRYINDEGKAAQEQLLEGESPVSLSNPVDMLVHAAGLPRKSILFMINGHFQLSDNGFVQAYANLRDEFKTGRRTAVLLGPQFNLPQAIQNDVLVLDEPYPDRAQLEEIVLRAHADAKMKLPSDGVTQRVVDAISGLPAYTAEQVTFMSFKKDEGLVLEDVWERKRKEVEKRKGASIWRGKEMFSDIKGMDNLIRYASLMKKSKRRVGLVLFLDEIEKMFAGLDGSLNPTMPELLGMFLTWFNDEDCVGFLMLGPGGTGKSLFGKALGNELGVPTLAANIAAMQAGIVGESGDNLMSFLSTAKGVAAGNRIVVVATCNKVAALPPELKRRFKRGIWFIDIPDETGLKSGVEYYMKKFELKDKKLPDMTDWTLAEVETCCEQADDYGISMQEASETIVPITQADPKSVEALRQLASNRFLSACYRGKYKMPLKKTIGQGREVN